MDELRLKNLIWLVFIVWNSFKDIRKKEISLRSCLVVGTVRVVLMVIGDKMNLKEFLMDCIPGAGFLVLSVITKNAIGAGDGVIVLITGWYLGMFAATEILVWGLFCSAIFGIVLLVLQKIHRNTEIPFVPFLLIGYIISIIE